MSIYYGKVCLLWRNKCMYRIYTKEYIYMFIYEFVVFCHILYDFIISVAEI